MKRAESVTEHRPEIDAIARWFTRAFADLDVMNADFCELLEGESQPLDDVGVIARLGRHSLKRRARRFLVEHDYVDGAGMIFSRSAEGDGRGVIEWWQRDAAQGVNRYSFGTTPTSDRFYDYEKLEWFVMSFGSGRHWITGPYFDYLGVDEYVVTLTARSIVHGRPIGVAALDVRMSDFERELLPLLQRFPARAALLSPHGTVLASNDTTLLPGDRVGLGDVALTLHPLDISGASVIVAHA